MVILAGSRLVTWSKLNLLSVDGAGTVSSSYPGSVDTAVFQIPSSRLYKVRSICSSFSQSWTSRLSESALHSRVGSFLCMSLSANVPGSFLERVVLRCLLELLVLCGVDTSFLGIRPIR